MGAVPLRVSPCRSLCDWRPSRAQREGEALFACTGCGSQWVRSEPWSPRQADGSWPDGVRDALLAGTGVTSDRSAGAAGTAGS